MTRRTTAFGAAIIALALVGSACSDGSGSFGGRKPGDWGTEAGAERAAERADTTEPEVEATADFDVQGSVNQIAVTNAKPGTELALVRSGGRRDGKRAGSAEADDAGSIVFRTVEAGRYRVVEASDDSVTSSVVAVVDPEDSLPEQSFYDDQELKDGFQYITTRDGTKLSAAVYLPPGDGPFPTVVEYSGYNPSDPTQSLLRDVGNLGLDESVCDTVRIICRKPAQPSSLIAAAMGYAVVAVNVRGTGCSGGSYDFFEPLQLLDGYDVIETVAAQPWVRGHKVGMVGLSYPGITQLFVASTKPPSLAAITPLSVYDDTAKGVLAPGGIFNKGFALAWARNVLNGAAPKGQGWEQKVIDGGDTQCVENQKLRGQNVDAVKKARSTEFYEPEIADPVNPSLWVDQIEVPVFMTGAWQDEQTGPRFVNLWDKFDGAPVKRFFGFNGAHADGDSPETLAEWKIFLDFYVAGERTPLPGFFRQFGPALIGDTFGTPVAFPPDRLLDGEFDDLKAQYEAEPDVTIMWERGGDRANPGAPESTGRSTFPSWPPPGQRAERWYLQPDGTLGATPPTAASSATRWVTDPLLADKVTLPGDKESQAFKALPEWEWTYDQPGEAAVFVSKPLAVDTVVLGTGSLDLWARVDAEDAPVGATISEVRPDGTELYVQSGIGRALLRKPGPDATELDPAQTGTEADAEPLPVNEWTQMRMPLLPFGHVFRKGARIRISIHTPGGDKPSWSWILDPRNTPTIDIGHDAAHPSSIVLPVVPATGYRRAFPPCPSLRGQPCREFAPYANQVVSG